MKLWPVDASGGTGNPPGNRSAIGIAFALSVLIHAAALWVGQPQLRPAFERALSVEPSGPLQLRLEPSAPSLPASPQSRAGSPSSLPPLAPKRPATVPQPRPTGPAPMTPPAPQVAPYRSPPELSLPAPPPPTRSVPEAPAAVASGGDLSAYIAARRRARQDGEPAPGAPVLDEETEAARGNRIVAANLGLGRKPSHGKDATGGGIFQIRRVSYDHAEYLFHGWNPDIRRSSTQVVTVRRGTDPDIRKAVVRSMIDIIRRHEQGDFLWESRRLGRNVELSARPADDAGLEDFLMREFFDEGSRPAAAQPR